MRGRVVNLFEKYKLLFENNKNLLSFTATALSCVAAYLGYVQRKLHQQKLEEQLKELNQSILKENPQYQTVQLKKKDQLIDITTMSLFLLSAAFMGYAIGRVHGRKSAIKRTIKMPSFGDNNSNLLSSGSSSDNTNLISFFSDSVFNNKFLMFGTSLSLGAVGCWMFYKELRKTKQLLEKEKENRQQERQGRIKAEIKLREIQNQQLLGQIPKSSDNNDTTNELASISNNTTPFLPIQPIGYLKSVYKTRNGCPRQPFYVNKGRAKLKLLPHCNPISSLDGLEEYSHCWIIFQFNFNTNLVKGANANSMDAIKSKIKPPRLMNRKVGLYATRTPHRYNAIGLSLVEIDRIDKKDGTLYLKGTDLIDNTVILDIKPYINGYDNLQNVRVPDWIKDPVDSLQKLNVEMSMKALNELNENIDKLEFFDKEKELDEFIEFLKQVLSYDIRSYNKKNKNVNEMDTHELIVDCVKVYFTIDDSNKQVNITEIKKA
ncbi:hypothetical protein ABK040_011751 [Willaertia magna]